jgi:hypothetical protein
MKTPLLIVLAVVVLGAGSALSVMNNACKSSHHPWLRSDSRHAAPRKDWAQLDSAAPHLCKWQHSGPGHAAAERVCGRDRGDD